MIYSNFTLFHVSDSEGYNPYSQVCYPISDTVQLWSVWFWANTSRNTNNWWTRLQWSDLCFQWVSPGFFVFYLSLLWPYQVFVLIAHRSWYFLTWHVASAVCLTVRKAHRLIFYNLLSPCHLIRLILLPPPFLFLCRAKDSKDWPFNIDF